jgi:tRNA-splicing ligase RtcB
MKSVINTELHPIKLWLDDADEGAIAQAKQIANFPFLFKWLALMPDAHFGFGMPIGGVAALKNVICPGMVGVDIGCGMAALRTNLTEISTDMLKQIMRRMRQEIPVGFNHHKKAQEWEGFDAAPDVPVLTRELDSARKQLGTLGGGNHFLEIQKGSDGFIWIMLHSGSRNFGFKTANEFSKIALDQCNKWHIKLPHKDLAYLPFDTFEGSEYFLAMNYCLKFAAANRQHMMNTIVRILGEETMGIAEEQINIHHNYAAMESHYGENVLVHRKGATCVRTGITGIIPGSMGTHSYIVDGLGNPESFHSCSHGAGRRMGRKEAVRSLDLAAEQEKMAGIVHGLRNTSDLEEAPGAYKSISDVMANQTDLVSIRVELTPLASMKG